MECEKTRQIRSEWRWELFWFLCISCLLHITIALKKGHHSTSISLCKVLLSVEEGDDTHLFGTMPLSPSSLESLSILPRISAWPPLNYKSSFRHILNPGLSKWIKGQTQLHIFGGKILAIGRNLRKCSVVSQGGGLGGYSPTNIWNFY